MINLKNKLSLKAVSPISSKRATRIAGNTIYGILRYVVLLSIGYIVLYPLLYAFVTSFRVSETLQDPTRQWILKEWTLENIKVSMDFLNYWKSLLKTVETEIVSALIEVVTCAVVAYGFARFDFKIKKICMAVLFLTILVPAPMIIIPLVTNYAHLDILGILGLFNKITGIDLRPNIVDTNLAFYLPSLFAVGLRSGIFIFIYIQFFKGLPRELEEAAYIDGAGPIKTFLRIALPSSGVVIITVLVFSLVWHWNDYILASMYMPGENVLGVSIMNFETIMQSHGIYMSNAGIVYVLSACVLVITPLLIVYLFLQRGFIESIDRVGITG